MGHQGSYPAAQHSRPRQGVHSSGAGATVERWRTIHCARQLQLWLCNLLICLDENELAAQELGARKIERSKRPKGQDVLDAALDTPTPVSTSYYTHV